MLLVVSNLIVNGPRSIEEVEPILAASGIESFSQSPIEFDLEFYVAGKLDRVHLERTDEVDEALHDCLSGKLEALSFPKLETHAKTRVQVHVALESPAPPEDVTKD